MPPRASDQADRHADPRDRIEPISMRIPDACRFTGISRSTLYLLIARGEVEIIKLGSSTLVLTESLRRLVEGRRVGGGLDSSREAASTVLNPR